MKSLRLLVVAVVLVSAIVLVRCGRSGGESPKSLLSGQSLQFHQPPENVQPFEGKTCWVSDTVILPTDDPRQSGPILWARGGGWEDNQTVASFARYVPRNGYAAIVLAAAPRRGSYDVRYFFNYYRDRMQNTQLRPVLPNFQGEDDPNSQAAAAEVAGASEIIITGGQPDALASLPGTKVGNAIVQAFLRGIPVYTNSASLSLIATQGIGNGLGLMHPYFVGHLENPQQYGVSPNDLWRLVPSRLQQSFGLTSGTLAQIANGRLKVFGATGSRVYVYDSRLPKTQRCSLWVLRSGQRFSM